MRLLLAGALVTLTAVGLAAIRPAAVSEEEGAAAGTIRAAPRSRPCVRRSPRHARAFRRDERGRRRRALVSTEAIGLAAAVLTTAAYVPQVVRIWKTRSAPDISWWMFGIMTLGALLWLVYGLRLPSLPATAANGWCSCCSAILVLKWRLGRNARLTTLRSNASRKT